MPWDTDLKPGPARDFAALAAAVLDALAAMLGCEALRSDPA